MKKLLNTFYNNSAGRYLSLDGENLVLLEENKELKRVPLHNIGRIMTFGYTGTSPALMNKCVENGIELVFMNEYGKFLSRVEGKFNGNVLLRREQYRIADDEQRSLDIARNMICAKLYNSKWILQRVVRDHPMRIDVVKFKSKIDMLDSSIKASQTAITMDSLRGIEGEGASVYFSLFDDMILQQNDDFTFSTRSKRPPLDNVNALLSFSYSLCTGLCTSALECVGLDPYVGFMHTDRPGRRSLAVDLVEEFRGVMCDRFVLMLINKKIVQKDDFIKCEDGAIYLTDEARRKFIIQWETKKKEEIKHPFLNEKVEWGMLPYSQALLLSRYIRGDVDSYPPFFWKC